VPAGVDRAAYRIVREALTNAARHGTGSADVVLDFGETSLDVLVTNPVPEHGSASKGGGHGIVGMRERALLLGGALEAGAADGVFRVHATLPYREAS
jgi:signal transduction histidine kinase